MKRFLLRNARLGWLLLVPLVALLGCGRAGEDDADLVVWCHRGQQAEYDAMQAIAAAFNEAHQPAGLSVRVESFPDHQYTEKLSAAAGAADLPDVVELDGPTVAQFVEGGVIAPLEPYIPAADLADFLPTIQSQGTIDNTLYALGAFDSALVLYYDREMLAQAGVNPPPDPAQGWSWDEFLVACRSLKSAGLEPVTLHMNESADEWYTYAFSPLIWMAGGRLVDEAERQAEGVLNSETNRAVLEQWQQLFTEGLCDSAPVEPNPFAAGTVAMDWTGHWMARGHLEAKGDRLGVMALPQTGSAPAAASGSWCWALTTQSRRPEAAATWIRWVTGGQTGVVPMTEANGAVPARISVLDQSETYHKPPYALFRTLLESKGRSRPRIADYPALTRAFAAALRDIAKGAEPGAALDESAAQVQRILDRRGR